MPRKQLRRLWQPRILAAVVLLTLAGLLAGAVYAYLSYREAAAQLIVERDRQVALLTAGRLRDELSKLSDELTGLARSPSLYLGLPDRQRQVLRGASGRLAMFDGGVIFVDNSGRVRATVPERWDIMSKDWSDKDFFRAMLVAQPPSVHFSPVLDIGPSNAPVIVMTVPVLGENRELVGTLSGLFKLGESRVSPFYASIVRLRLPGTGNTYIADSSGRIVYDSGYVRTGETMPLPDNSSTAADTLTPTKDAEGHEVIASYAPVPGTGWTLVTETDWAAAMAPVQQFATGLIVLLGLGMIIPTLGVALLARGRRTFGSDAEIPAADPQTNALVRRRLFPAPGPDAGRLERCGASPDGHQSRNRARHIRLYAAPRRPVDALHCHNRRQGTQRPAFDDHGPGRHADGLCPLTVRRSSPVTLQQPALPGTRAGKRHRVARRAVGSPVRPAAGRKRRTIRSDALDG